MEEGEASPRLEGMLGLHSSEKPENVELFGQLDLSGLSDGLVPVSRVFSADLHFSSPLYTKMPSNSSERYSQRNYLVWPGSQAEGG